MTPERRKEVRRLLAATSRHLAAKERGENSNLGRARALPLGKDGKPTGPWVDLGVVTISFNEIDPELLRLITGKES